MKKHIKNVGMTLFAFYLWLLPNMGNTIEQPVEKKENDTGNLSMASILSKKSEQDFRVDIPDLNSSPDPDKLTEEDVERYVAQGVQTLSTTNWKDLSSEKIKQDAQNQLRSRTESYVRSQVHENIIRPIESAAEDFLGQFGTAKVNLSVSDKGRLKGSSISLFSPWYDNKKLLTFTQFTLGDHDSRTIANFGVGQRWNIHNDAWLLGYNAFYDYDISRRHSRLGLGVEAWSDFLKLSANYYTPLSQWRDSKDFDHYLERAARGFDVRAQAYLPSYPYLGASLMYERYFGEEVALFGKDNLQQSPYALTVGVDYTPIPLLTIKGSHKAGNGKQESKIDMLLNYRLGVPFYEQIDPSKVAMTRSLKGSRYDFVDRNNNIVLEYKEKKAKIELFLDNPIITEGDDFVAEVRVLRAEPLFDTDWWYHRQDEDNNRLRTIVNPQNCSTKTDITRQAGQGASGDCTPSIVKLSYNNIVNNTSRQPIEIVNDKEVWRIKAPAYDSQSTERNIYKLKVKTLDFKGRIIESPYVTVQVQQRANMGGYLEWIAANHQYVAKPSVGYINYRIYPKREDNTYLETIVDEDNNYKWLSDFNIVYSPLNEPENKVVVEPHIIYEGSDATCPVEKENCLVIIEGTRYHDNEKNAFFYTVKFSSNNEGVYEISAKVREQLGQEGADFSTNETDIQKVTFKSDGGFTRKGVVTFTVETKDEEGNMQRHKYTDIAFSDSRTPIKIEENLNVGDSVTIDEICEIEDPNDPSGKLMKQVDCTVLFSGDDTDTIGYQRGLVYNWILYDAPTDGCIDKEHGHTADSYNKYRNEGFVVHSSALNVEKNPNQSLKNRYKIPINSQSLVTAKNGEATVTDLLGNTGFVPSVCGDQGFKLKVTIE